MRPRVKTWTVRLDRWASRAPLKVVCIADLHATSPWMSIDRVARIVDQAQALGGDLIALLGDYVGHIALARAATPAEIAPVLGRLSAPLGVWAVFGNHDWWDDPAARDGTQADTIWHRAFADQGIGVLENQSILLDHSGGFALAGLGSQRALVRSKTRRKGVDDLNAALHGIPPDVPTLLMVHEPDVFPELPDTVDLTLAGHTHGGQITFFGYAPVVPSRFGRRYAYGHIREGGRDMVVSAGLGCTTIPLRFGAWPEITVVEVR